jgi:CRISPR/Cas system-associated exonuclease Cas4 (RecB family)
LRPNSRPADPGRYIRASEISEYAYCPRAWWLEHVLGYAGDNWIERERGRREHSAHGLRVRLAALARSVAVFLLITGALALVVASVARLAR